MEETPVQIRALADSRPPGRLFIADLRQSHAPNNASFGIESNAFKIVKWDESTSTHRTPSPASLTIDAKTERRAPVNAWTTTLSPVKRLSDSSAPASPARNPPIS